MIKRGKRYSPKFGILSFLIVICVQEAYAAGRETVTVERGYERYLDIDQPVKRLSIGDSKIADVSLIDDKTLRILGLAPGKTTFTLWNTESGAPVVYEVVVAPSVGDVRDALARDRSLSPAQLHVEGGKIVLSGRFGDAGSQKKARDLTAQIAGSDVIDMTEVATDKVVQIDVQFATISKSTLDGLGLNFSHLGQQFSIATTAPNTLDSFALNPSGSTGLSLATASPIASAFNLLLGSPKYNKLAIISALKSNNLAQTIAEPTLVVRSGEKADFLVGGEIPIPVPQGGNSNAITIEYKRFGVSLKVEPTILKDRRIALTISPEVSELDFTNAITIQGFTIPALRTRETLTTVEMGENEPLILAGLMYATAGNVDERVPYLSEIPVLGEFFKRTRDTRETQELVVSVTPRLVTAASQNRALQTRVRQGLRNISLAPDKEPAP